MSGLAEKREAEPMCIYIAARGHSGSTMLELLLNRYTRIAAIGEVDQLPLQILRDGIRTKWEGLCSCKSRPSDCEYWRAVFECVSRQSGVDMLAYPFSFPVSAIGLSQEYGWRAPVHYARYAAHRLIRSIYTPRESTGSRVLPYEGWVRNRELIYRVLADRHRAAAVVDASKDPLQMGDLVRYAQLPVKVLFLTRDVRGNAWSAVRRRRSGALQEARDWASVNARILSPLQKLPKSTWMHVKYEDLCADTGGTLRKLMDFVGIDGGNYDPESEHASRHTIAGNSIRFEPLRTVRHDVAWRNNLSAGQLDDVRRAAGAVAGALDYEI